ncbi:MAG: hypothetical protein GY737_07965 [Desulfobacteraceae bacterium]|nr:hypothetical protein [Desulfobacteraceae bacterium]
MKRLIGLLAISCILTSCNGVSPQLNIPSQTQQVVNSGFKGSSKITSYPNMDRIPVFPNEEVTFEIILKVDNPKYNKLIMDFDDNTASKYIDLAFDPKGTTKVYVPHSYKKEGNYTVAVEIAKSDLKDVHKLNVHTIFITPKVESDAELKDKAEELLAAKLTNDICSFLKKKNKKRAKLALSMLDNANFEYTGDEKVFKLIQTITKSLVNNKVTVLEKSPAALVRLAHESVTQIGKNGKKSTKPLKRLEYGLMTEYQGASMPFFYGAKIEGVDDYQIVSGVSSKNDSERDQKSSSKNSGLFASVTKSVKEKVSTEKHSDTEQSEKRTVKSSRPLLVASFDTADYLTVIYILKDLNLVKTKSIYFDPKYNKEMIERTASMRINARILNKNGVIEWIKDIDSVVKDRVISDYEDYRSKIQ